MLLFTILTVPLYAEQPAESDESQLLFAPADGGAPPAGQQDREGDEGAAFRAFGLWDLLRMVLVLLLVVGAVYAVVSLLRRRVTPRETEDPDAPIRVLATQSLSPGRDVHAVMIGRQVLILGSGESAIQLISTVEDQETIDELVLAHSRKAPPPRTFGSLLSRWMANMAVPGSAGDARSAGGTSAGGSGGTGGSAGSGFLSGQRQRLRRLR